MPTIPAAMLKQLYRRGSLRNTETGWEFAVRNHLAPATLTGLGLTCDGVEVALAAVTVAQPDRDVLVEAAAISAEAPVRFPVQVDTVVRVAGAALAPGAHALAMRADTREIGAVVITVQDTVAG